MKTITFYSYKGGVGRSLALTNIAVRLSEIGQRVCIVDFDLDAPGLHFKFKNYELANPINRGIVDYIHLFSSEKVIDQDLESYAVILEPAASVFQPITMIPAGNIDSPEYWKKLSMINWSDLFYAENASGVSFFLDFKAKIEKVFKPDFLLIDSRTGITDISGITLRLLAEQVVILCINNKENLFGSKKIIKSLTNPNNALFGTTPKINFVLSRVPFGPNEKEKEFLIVEKLKHDFKTDFNLPEFDVSVIHSDKRIEEEESYLSSPHYDYQPGSISNDYLKLFETITGDQLHLDDRFLTSKRAEVEFHKSNIESGMKMKMQHINKAIELDSSKYAYYIARGVLYAQQGNASMGIDDHLKALELNPVSPHIRFNLGLLYMNLKQYDEALKYLRSAERYGPIVFLNIGLIYARLRKPDKAIDAFDKALALHPSFDMALNGRADQYRSSKQFQQALSDITKAIELNSNQPIFFATLAEIYADMDKIEEFYLNLAIALSKGLKTSNMYYAREVYERFFNDERFIALISKYDMNIDDFQIDPEQYI
ncbi:KGGVGR-motif variant AAA ATPase [Mucilaginibacter sp. P25]|uniref:Tetratricopeptide repeat-containing protein n=1 Tax=Mucilaginibacter gossypii TaxID=551996 RepID=A0A1G8JAC6_9SPHI|nr:tetratricopeptide repeat protein [Mucilaginibacter gossypii]SDI28219.1 Tetratricopeptide repeat-containing protein [Mucilaginibacter gossypii]